MSAQPPVRLVCLDALGTMVELEPPVQRLARALGVPADTRLRDALAGEIGYYREHCHTGSDAASLTQLRARCAEVLAAGLGRPVDVEAMMSALRFRAYPDAAPALAELRRMGLSVVCVSNWDCSLPDVLAGCGLAGALDGVVTAAEVGARKPDPAVFAAALERVGCCPGEAVHVGDSAKEDVAGARAAGIRALHLRREGGGEVRSLAEVPGRVVSMGA